MLGRRTDFFGPLLLCSYYRLVNFYFLHQNFDEDFEKAKKKCPFFFARKSFWKFQNQIPSFFMEFDFRFHPDQCQAKKKGHFFFAFSKSGKSKSSFLFYESGREARGERREARKRKKHAQASGGYLGNMCTDARIK
jgi:hypothetical protein